MISDYILNMVTMPLGWIYIAMAIITFTLAFQGAKLYIWTLWLAILLLETTTSEQTLMIAAGVALILNVPLLRRLFISTPIAKILKALNFLPAISETEKVAIESGSVWLDGELFSGKPNFKTCLKEAYPKLSKTEQRFLDSQVEEACSMTSEWEINQKRDLPNNVWNYLKKEGFFGMIIPKKYGGLGFSALAHSTVIAKLSSRATTLGITTMVPNSLGPAELLIHYGTKAQKDYYLPRLASGKDLPCFGLTEPHAGSDAGAIQSSGEIFKDKDGTLKMKLNWNKRWITLAAVSTVIGLAFKLNDPKNLLGKGEDLGITCALIPAETPGVVLGKRHDPLGIPFFNCPTQGNNVVVGLDTIIGGPDYAGQGWKMLMGCLAAGRGISLPANATGGAKMTLRVASAFSVVRKQFGLSIGKFEGIEEPLARIGGYSYLMDAARIYTAGGIDSGQKPPIVSAIVKYHFTELFRTIINDGMDILGGAAITRGKRNQLASAYIATPIGITVEGANILTRTLMIFGQGVIRCHPFARLEVEALETGNMALFDKAFIGHVGHVIRNKVRAIALSLTRGRLASAPVSGKMARYYRKLAWVSASFAFFSDVALATLGGNLKRKEKITGRFADILSWMYLSLSILRRFEAEGQRKEDEALALWGLETAFYEIQVAFEGLFNNMGCLYKPLLWWTKINPLSQGPSDALGHKVASLIQTEGKQRDRLSQDIFMATDKKDPHSLLERAFKAMAETAAIEDKMKKAVRNKVIKRAKGLTLVEFAFDAKVITKKEKDALLATYKLCDEAIQVDDFTLEEYDKGVF